MFSFSVGLGMVPLAVPESGVGGRDDDEDFEEKEEEEVVKDATNE